MSSIDVLPAPDHEFDTLQGILVAAVTLKLIPWDIPATELAKLTAKKTIWDAIWLIAKDKQNSTSAQKKAKDVARAGYSKVLRPFIQKWIYRNENMDDSDIETCGLKPRDPNHTPANIPDKPVVKVKHGASAELISSCPAVPGAKHYGCIITEAAAIPDWLAISADGRIVIDMDSIPPSPGPEIKSIICDLTDQRVKHFKGMKKGATYYFYYYAVNAAGVSELSDVVVVDC